MTSEEFSKSIDNKLDFQADTGAVAGSVNGNQVYIKQQVVHNYSSDSVEISDYDTSKKIVKVKSMMIISALGSLEDTPINRAKLKAIEAQMQELTGDFNLKIMNIDEGSIKITIQGAEDSIDRLEELFRSGDLKIIEDIPITELRKLSELEKIQYQRKRKLVRQILNKKIPNLVNANLVGANLVGINFTGVNLQGCKLMFTNLEESIFSRADLEGADLSGANLEGATFSRANLEKARLVKANLLGVNFYKSDLEKSNLAKANLTGANLSGARLSSANLSSTVLTEACFNDCHTNDETNFENVICDYIYLGWDQEKKLPTKRIPSDSDRNFAPGEFTKLFQEKHKVLDLVFEEEIDWQAFTNSSQNIQLESEHGELDIRAIEKSSNGSFVIRVDVPENANKADIEAKFYKRYEHELKQLQEVHHQQLEAKDREIESYRRESLNMAEIAKLLASKVTPQNLTQAAEDIRVLIDQLESDFDATPMGNMQMGMEVVSLIDQNPTLKSRVINALKETSVAAFEEAISHPVASIVIAGTQGFIEAE